MDQNFSIFQDFIKKQFSNYNQASFEELETWSSMQSLIIVSAIDEKYNVLISHEELNELKTIKELYQLVQKKA